MRRGKDIEGRVVIASVFVGRCPQVEDGSSTRQRGGV